MKYGVLGTGMVGQAISNRLVELGHEVMIGVRDPARSVAGGDHDMFVCWNDPSAKEVVVGILKDFGWSHITDLGDLSAARGMEMYLPIWLRLWGALGSGMFNIKVAR